MDKAIQNDSARKPPPVKLTEAFGQFEKFLEPMLRSRLSRVRACMDEIDDQLGLVLAAGGRDLRKNNKLIQNVRSHLESILDVIHYCASNSSGETSSMVTSLLGRNRLSLAHVTGSFLETAVETYKSVYPDGRALELYFGDNTYKLEERIVSLLSARELDVLALIMKGDPNKIIAYKLGVSEATIKAHVSSILKKLGARNRAYLVARIREFQPVASNNSREETENPSSDGFAVD